MQSMGFPAPTTPLNDFTSQLRRAAGLDGGGGSVTGAVQSLRTAAGLPIGQPQTSQWSSQGRAQPFNVLAGEGYQQAPAQQRFSPLRNEGYRNGPF
jgi:hypothetical protein